MKRSAKLIVALGVATFIGLVAACWGDGPTSPDRDRPGLTVVLSDTSVLAAGAALAAGMVTSLASASEAEVTYVSLPPGSVLDGESAVINNRRTQWSVTTFLVAGGFDPVSIGARTGDTLETVVSRSDGDPIILLSVVPRRRPPTIVRTIPPRGKTDVPLNVRTTIVFSEPLDAQTLTPASVQLQREGAPVAGRLEFADSETLEVAFVPDAPLAAATNYVLVVSGEIRDQDGESLEAPVTVEFTTEAAPVGAGLLAYFGHMGIYVANADGRFPTRIHQREIHAGHTGLKLSWSPDAGRIAFAAPRFRDFGQPGSGIFVINADGSGLLQLTRPTGIADDIQPAWSPDGGRIAFVGFGENGSTLDPSLVIHVVRVDGTGMMTLGAGEHPAWSPDARRIAFSNRDGIYVINVDGSGLRRLTNDGGEPAWSPDGSRIAFVSSITGNLDIHVIQADGSGSRRLTNNPAGDVSPMWSPDGTRIAFTRESSGWDDLYLMNSDGSNPIRLTNTAASEEVHPAWSLARISRPPSFTVEAVPRGDAERQIDTVFATLKQPFQVRVLRDGQPAQGVTVRWSVTGGSVSPTVITTDTLGVASIAATLGGPVPQWLVAEAAVSGALGSPVVFHAAGKPGNPARVQFDGKWRYDPDRNPLTDDGRALVALSDATLQYGVETTDAHGNIVLGVRIDFAVISGGGSVSPAVDTTEYWQEDYCSGCLSAFTRHRLGNSLGPQSVTATAGELPGAPHVTFTAIPVSVIIIDGACDDRSSGFYPAHVSELTGATVGWRLWCGRDNPHNVTFEDDTTQPVSSGNGRLHTRTFNAPGIYRYRCTRHSTSFIEGEVGTVTIR